MPRRSRRRRARGELPLRGVGRRLAKPAAGIKVYQAEEEEAQMLAEQNAKLREEANIRERVVKRVAAVLRTAPRDANGHPDRAAARQAFPEIPADIVSAAAGIVIAEDSNPQRIKDWLAASDAEHAAAEGEHAAAQAARE